GAPPPPPRCPPPASAGPERSEPQPTATARAVSATKTACARRVRIIRSIPAPVCRSHSALLDRSPGGTIIRHVKMAQRGSPRRRAWPRRAAPLGVIAVLSLAGGAATTRAVDADRHRAAQHRADIDAQEIRNALERARTFVVGFGNALEGEPRPNPRRSAALDASAAPTVGLPTALWVEQVAGRDRAAYEQRTRRRIKTLDGRRVGGRAPVYLPATFLPGVRLPAAVDVSGLRALAATLRDPTAIFTGTATPMGTLGGRRGFFVVQGGRFGRGPGSTGFLVVFVPSGWLGLSLAEDQRRIAIDLDGRRL